MIRAVAVFLSSTRSVDPLYTAAARETGRALAAEGWTTVYGGTAVGCMGALAEAARAAGGRVVGVVPQFFVDRGYTDPSAADAPVIVATMRQRKQEMEDRADAFLALPGGLGTFEELFEIVVARQLGLHDKPIVLLNVNGYYTPLLDMIRRGVEGHFVRPEALTLYQVADTVPDAIALIRSPRPIQGKSWIV